MTTGNRFYRHPGSRYSDSVGDSGLTDRSDVMLRSILLRSHRLTALRGVGPERARQKSVARFNLDYVVTVAADFEVEHTGAGEVIEASFRLACR